MAVADFELNDEADDNKAAAASASTAAWSVLLPFFLLSELDGSLRFDEDVEDDRLQCTERESCLLSNVFLERPTSLEGVLREDFD